MITRTGVCSLENITCKSGGWEARSWKKGAAFHNQSPCPLLANPSSSA